MVSSERFIALQERLDELRRHLLPHEFSPIGEYDPVQLDMAKGYRLLTHAEFESYLEDVSKETVLYALQQWRRNKKPSMTIVSFLAAYHSCWAVGDEQNNQELISLSRARTNPKESLSEIMNIASKQFIDKIGANHGIKAKNFKSLIFPTGIDIDELEPEMLPKLDSFGSKRGEIAHLSARVNQQINPKDEFDDVTFLLECFRTLDEKLVTIKNAM
ncbi:HEPN domain-containing protein [Enterobacter asburiae]